MNSSRNKAVLLATCVVAFSASPALAQTAPGEAPAPTANGSAELDEAVSTDIIVTAQRRDESLSRTPVAVTVVSADTLAKANIVTENDLRVVAPGLSIRSTVSTNQINYALRGQSKDAFSGTRPGVLPYINEVQIGGDGGTVFYDLGATQVLKGPQGTLFGRSATGGAVLLTTAKPTDEFGGYASALYGNYDALKFEGAINAPLAGDRLMARVAGFYQKRDGYQSNGFTGGREGKLDRWGVRGSLSANVGIFHNDLVVDYFKSDSENTFNVLSGLVPFTGGAGGPFLPITFLYGGTSTPLDRAIGIGTVQAFLPPAFAGAVPGFYDAFFANPAHPNTGITSFLRDQQARGPYKVFTNAANFYKAENYVVTNATTIDLGDNARIRNIVGYTNLDSRQAFNVDGTPYEINFNGRRDQPFGYRQRVRQFSDELQLQGTAISDRLDYVVGGYYSDEKLKIDQTSVTFSIVLGGGRTDQDYANYNTTYAGYAQGTYKLNDDGLAVTGGVRYTSEKARLVIGPGDTNFPLTTTPGFAAEQSTTFNRVSWQIGLQNQLTPQLLLYVVSRRAYKSGGFNGAVAPRVGSAVVGGNAFDAERVTDAELGAKYNGRLGEAPLRLSLALFHNWIDDAQRASYTLVGGAPAAITVNVPQARAYGAEFDASVQPARWFSAGVQFNYIRSKFQGIAAGQAAIPGCDGATANSNGSAQCYDQFPDTPKYTVSTYADFTVPVTERIDLLLHGDVYMQSKSFTGPQSGNNLFGGTIPSYILTNFRAGVEDRTAGWSLTANLKNAFNNVYYTGGVATGLLYQVNTFQPGEPRTYTVEARFKF